MFKKRALTVAAGIPLVLLTLYAGGIYYLFLLIIISIIGLKEYFYLIKTKGYKPLEITGYFSILLFFFIIYIGAFQVALPLLVFSFLFMFTRPVIQFPKYNILESALSLWGIIYIGVIFGSLFALRQLPEGFNYSIFLFIAIWANDIGAYLTGFSIGKHPLAPKISPGKSWEGSFGGIIVSIITLMVAKLAIPDLFPFSPTETTLWGGSIAVLGQLGDLAESSLKREAGLKDSGKLLPGHGGILDRFDSFVYAAPFFYFFCCFFR